MILIEQTCHGMLDVGCFVRQGQASGGGEGSEERKNAGKKLASATARHIAEFVGGKVTENSRALPRGT